MKNDIKKIFGNSIFRSIDQKNNLFLADPFIYKIFPEDYTNLAELLIINNELFTQIDAIQKDIEKFKSENSSPYSELIPENMQVYKYLDDAGTIDNNLPFCLKLLKNYKSFFKEAGTSLKFNPLSSRESAGQIRLRLFELLKKYLTLIEPKVLLSVVKAGRSQNGLILKDVNALFRSSRLADFFTFFNEEDEMEIIIYVATIGPNIDDEVKSLSKSGDIFDAYILNGVGSGAVEMVAKDLNLFINDSSEIIDSSLKYKRFSPGYNDWNIEDQQIIFDLLSPEKYLGVSLTDSYVMIPEKSTSGIMGLTSKIY